MMEGKLYDLADSEMLLESLEIMLAGTASHAAGGKTVHLDKLKIENSSFTGNAFWEFYRHK